MILKDERQPPAVRETSLRHCRLFPRVFDHSLRDVARAKESVISCTAGSKTKLVKLIKMDEIGLNGLKMKFFGERISLQEKLSLPRVFH